jgi:shikimate kinase
MNVFLIGYMGSGKSSVGKKLSEVLHYGYLDLDDYIQQQEGKTITEIFKNRGEIYFRKVESQYLKELISSKNNTIISLGGGTPCYGTNMEVIKNSNDAISIYLKTSIAILSDRLFLEKDKRPLISHLEDKDELIEFIGKHLFERSAYYNESEIIINTDQKSLDEVVEMIVARLI